MSSEFELSHFFEGTPDLVCLAGKNGFFKNINPSVVKKLGYSKAELMARPIHELIHPDDRQITRETRLKMLEGEALLNFVNRYVTKSGEIIWLEWTSIYFAEKDTVFAIAKDVSRKRLAEQEVEKKYYKFKSLASHFKNTIEKDRKFLAYELHEEIAQLASVLKMQLDMITLSEPGIPNAASAKIEQSAALAGLLMKTIQRISFSISPAMLDEFGLKITLEWLCKEFGILSAIPCSILATFDEGRLSREIKFDFFRICQGALSNIMYHAQATDVAISIYDELDKTFMYVRDNGKGFDVNQDKPSPGLKGIAELAASINGILSIESSIGHGTKIGIAIQHDECPEAGNIKEQH